MRLYCNHEEEAASLSDEEMVDGDANIDDEEMVDGDANIDDEEMVDANIDDEEMVDANIDDEMMVNFEVWDGESFEFRPIDVLIVVFVPIYKFLGFLHFVRFRCFGGELNQNGVQIAELICGIEATGEGSSVNVPSPIQSHAWPFLLDCRDLIGITKTGSGKNRGSGRACPWCSILSPIRELAQQIVDVLCEAGKSCGVKSICLFGGSSKGQHIQGLKSMLGPNGSVIDDDSRLGLVRTRSMYALALLGGIASA
ncbi:hypothetical protein Sjap_022045 [Stephania japonica]|uniref:DEAD/DEAH-box helicase domain-containing protein n=1 Tax=Stephania japonica TaxID=461633 RepID=A0AAP0EVC4_9MAGN